MQRLSVILVLKNGREVVEPFRVSYKYRHLASLFTPDSVLQYSQNVLERYRNEGFEYIEHGNEKVLVDSIDSVYVQEIITTK